ncbi:MAG TPA: hypothetical protein DHV15_00775 [Treponema sp.]|uniref:Uncharacterized protein n=1 Tax=Treponema denticola (strain ATCC 35405 / DSM 14222 / CIP 103919 / JCM 8153 / KCTC 15104) TaxID=243275 RepID=Q73P87_TREDE|nr:hypothetical protein TDE_0912 [Treponema denticola ATCC 35405]HCY94035.1 hypothetical protein [Treponema sp.]
MQLAPIDKQLKAVKKIAFYESESTAAKAVTVA